MGFTSRGSPRGESPWVDIAGAFCLSAAGAKRWRWLGRALADRSRWEAGDMLGWRGRGAVNASTLAIAVGMLASVACSSGGGGAEVHPRQLAAFSSHVGFYYAPPTLAAGHVYVGTGRGFLYPPASDNALFKLTPSLTKVWQYDLGASEVRGAATLDSAGNVYFVAESGRTAGDVSAATQSLVSLDAAGAFRWSAPIVPAGSAWHVGMLNPAVSASDVVYVGGDKLYAFASDGTLLWTYGAGLRITNAPIIDAAGNVYFSSAVRLASVARIISVDPDGNERWVFEVGEVLETLSSPAFSPDGSRIVVGLGRRMYCVGAADGAEIWSWEPGPEVVAVSFRATPAVDAAGNVYAGTKGNEASVFYAIRADGTGLLWSSPIHTDLYSSPALGTDGTVYVASEYSQPDGKRLHALDMATGARKWAAPLPADVTWSSPAIADDGTLYISTMAFEWGPSGAVLAFDTDSNGLLGGAGSARFHQGNASTGRR